MVSIVSCDLPVAVLVVWVSSGVERTGDDARLFTQLGQCWTHWEEQHINDSSVACFE